MIVMVDNYDSFTFNLVQYLRELAGAEEMRVVRNDEVPAAEVVGWRPRALVVSPGPGTPEAAGISVEVLRRDHPVPVLGVCLGHQALAAAFGGDVIRAPEPRHGKVSTIHHDGSGVFAGLPNPFSATRYHSLAVSEQTLPPQLRVTAWSEDGLIMGLSHRTRPLYGVQFHPESYLTREGHALLANFLELSGIEPDRTVVATHRGDFGPDGARREARR